MSIPLTRKVEKQMSYAASGALVAVKLEDYATAIKTAVKMGLFDALEAGLREDGIDQVVMEERFYTFIKAAINKDRKRCSCGNSKVA